MTNEERMLAWQNKQKQIEYRKDAKATTLNTEIGDDALGEGESSLVKRRNMVNEINTLQKSGKLMRTDKGFYITDPDKQNLMADAVFKNTLSSVNSHNDGLKQQVAEQEANAVQQAKEQQITKDANSTGDGLSVGAEEAIANEAQTNLPVGTIGDQIWEHVKGQDTRMQARYGLLGLDIASTGVSWLPVGNLVSAGMGLVSTVGNAALDFTDENVSAADAWSNLGMGVALDGASVFGAKGMKTMSSVGKMKPLIKTILPIMKTGLAGLGAYGGMNAMKGMTEGDHSKWSDLLNRDLSTWDSADYMEAITAARFLMGVTRTAGRKTVGAVRGKNAAPSVYDRGDIKGANVVEHVVSRASNKSSQLDINEGRKQVHQSGVDFEKAEKLVGRNQKYANKVNQIDTDYNAQHKKNVASYDKVKDVSSEKLAGLTENERLAGNRAAKLQTAESSYKAKAAKQMANMDAAVIRNKQNYEYRKDNHDIYNKRQAEAQLELDDYKGTDQAQIDLYEQNLRQATTNAASSKVKMDKAEARHQNSSDHTTAIGTKHNNKKVKYDKLVKKAKGRHQQRKDDKVELANITPEEIQKRKAASKKSGNLVKKAKNKKEKADEALEMSKSDADVAQAKKNETEDDLKYADESRRPDKGTVDKMEKEHRQLIETSERSERDLTQSKKAAQKIHDEIDVKDKAAKKTAKENLDAISDKITKNAATFKKNIDESQAKLDKELGSWRKYDRGLTRGLKGAWDFGVGGIGNIAGELSLTGSDARHVTLGMRAETERRRLNKKNNKQSNSNASKAVKSAKEYRKKKADEEKAKKAKKATQQKAMGGKLIARPTYKKGGKLIQKLQSGGGMSYANNPGYMGRLEDSLSDALAGAGTGVGLPRILSILKGLSKEDLEKFNYNFKDKRRTKKQGWGDSSSLNAWGASLFGDYEQDAVDAILDDLGDSKEDLKLKETVNELFSDIEENKLITKGTPEEIAKFNKENYQETNLDANGNLVSTVNPDAASSFWPGDNQNELNYAVPKENLEEGLEEDLEEKKKEISKKSEDGNGVDGGDDPTGTKPNETSLAEQIKQQEAEESIALDQTLAEATNKNVIEHTNYNDIEGFNAKGTGFGETASNVLSKVNIGDLYNIGQLFKKPEKFTANFTPSEAASLSKRAVTNMPGYQEMKAEASRPTYNVKTNDLMAKQTLQKRNVNAKNEKLRKLNAANASFVERQEAQNVQTGNRNRLNKQQVNNQNTQMKNQRNMQAAQLDAQAAAQLDKNKAQTLGSIGIRLNQGVEEAMAARSGNKYSDQLGQVNHYTSYGKNRMNETTIAKNKEKADLTAEYDKGVKDGIYDPTISTLDTYLEKNTNAGADWNQSDEILRKSWDADYAKKYGVNVNSDVFASKTDALEQDYLNRRKRIRLDPKNA